MHRSSKPPEPVAVGAIEQTQDPHFHDQKAKEELNPAISLTDRQTVGDYNVARALESAASGFGNLD